MSFLGNLFGGADNAAKAQINSINQGQQQAQGNINTGNQDLTQNYGAALQPFLQNYGQAQQGVTQLGNVLGLNGPAGGQQAQTTLETTPGYQFALQQGKDATAAQAQATGMGGSGNEALALQKQGEGLASQTYNNYVSQLNPFLGASASAAGGIAGVNTGLGSGLNQNQNNLANINYGADVSKGNAQASADLANQSMWQNILGGLGGDAMKLLTMSDERLKEDIEPVGELFDGQPVYSYKYKWDETPRIGLMAQNVEKLYPDAVGEVGGFKAVDYGKATEYASELGRFLKEAA